MPFSRYSLLITSLITLTLVATGCASFHARFVEEDRTYTDRTATRLLESTDPGDLAERPVADAPGLRQAALASLRRQGSGAEEAANIITQAFPTKSAGVPYLVTQARYGNDEALFVLEARGRSGGHLSNRLLWVIDLHGDVLFSCMR